MSWKELQGNPIMTVLIYALIIFFVVFSTKAYVGYLAIEQAIQGNTRRKAQLEERSAYLRDFRLPYVESEYAKYFAPHENGMAHPNEQIIKFVKQSEVIVPVNTQTLPAGVYVPNSSGGRSEYIKYKIHKIGD